MPFGVGRKQICAETESSLLDTSVDDSNLEGCAKPGFEFFLGAALLEACLRGNDPLDLAKNGHSLKLTQENALAGVIRTDNDDELVFL